MKNKRVIPLICLMIGIILIASCLIGKDLNIFETYKSLFGVMLGVGSGLFGSGFGQLISILMIDRNPILKKKQEIENNDERNIYINDKAKAKSFNIMEYAFPISILIVVLLDADIIITVIMIMSYIIMYSVYIYHLVKYTKEIWKNHMTYNNQVFKPGYYCTFPQVYLI